jgi:GntR family transcriptional regulator
MSAKPVDPLGDDYAYVQVADDLESRIKHREFAEKLPSERDLADEYGTAYTTVRHAMAVLRERGLIVSRQGRGTYVRKQR